MEYCPYCSSNRIAHIVYGLPPADDEKINQLINGEIVFGECTAEAFEPYYHCRNCGREIWSQNQLISYSKEAMIECA